MNYINPIGILQLQDADVSAIDGPTIKKAKRRLLADIELSDKEFLLFGKQQITKADVERVVSELDNQEKDKQFNQIKNNLRATTINLLPQYFHSLRNQAAQSIRNFSVTIFNTTGNYQLSPDIIDYALTFIIDENKKIEFQK